MKSYKKAPRYILWIIFAVIIGLFIGFWVERGGRIVYSQFQKQKNTEMGETVPPTRQEDYFVQDLENLFELSAQSYLVGDLETGKIILSKDKDKNRAIASVSKLVSALVVQEENRLIYPMLLESSNAAAEKLAAAIGWENFIGKMNQQAAALGMFNTSFADPSGLSKNNISTAEDLFKLIRHLVQNRPEILAITAEEKHQIGDEIWFNKNRLVNEDGYQGGKTGFTNAAGRTFAGAFSVNLAHPPGENKKERQVAIILLQSVNRTQDVKKLINYLEKNIHYGEKGVSLTLLQEKLNKESEAKKGRANLMFVGDIMIDRGVRSSVQKNFFNDFSFLFNNLEMLRRADILFGNLEGPASDEGEDLGNLYSFRMPPGVLPILAEAGFDILSVANNHAGDWGRAAFEDTLKNLEENEILAVGGNFNKADAETPRLVNVNGVQIGFLAFSDVGPDWLEAGQNKSGILLTGSLDFSRVIKNAAPAADILAVSIHFGEEYQKHGSRQEKLARLAIDSGAKIVIGHHPHVIQDIEFYNGGLIAYSLGNFIFDQDWSEETMKGLLLEVRIEDKKISAAQKYLVKLNQFFQPYQIVLYE